MEIRKMLIIALLMFVVALLTGCGQEMAVWGLGNEESLTVRIGCVLPDGNEPNDVLLVLPGVADENGIKVEAGIESSWLQRDNVPQSYGLYAIGMLHGLVKFNNPLQIDFLADQVDGTAYIGGRFGLKADADGSYSGFETGMIFNKILVVAYDRFNGEDSQSPVDGDEGMFLGLRIPIKFKR